MALEINTINKYFQKIYSEEEFAEFNKKLTNKLISYKFPLEICLSSTFESIGTLLGTLNFVELDINKYPTYIGDVTKTTEGSFGVIYSTTLNFDYNRNRWTFLLTYEQELVTITSERTNSLNPIKVNYSGISRPTSGACKQPK